MKKAFSILAVVWSLVFSLTAFAAPSEKASPTSKLEEFHRHSVQIWDAYGRYYQEFDGVVRTNVASPSDIDQATKSVIRTGVVGRGTFSWNNPMLVPQLVSGWMEQTFTYSGYYFPEGLTHYKYLVVHKTDPRYTGNPKLIAWPDWEFHVLNSGQGNVIPNIIKL